MKSSRAATPPMRSQLIGPPLRHVRAVGGDPAALLAELKLPADAETAPEVVLPLDRLHAFFAAAERVTGDGFLGVHLARGYERGTYGMLEFAARSAPNVRQALRRIARYLSLVNEIVRVRFDEHGDHAVFSHEIPGEPLCIGRHGNEFVVCALVEIGRQLTRAPFLPERVWLAHPAPPDPRELVAALGGVPLTFGAGQNGLELNRALLDLPIASSDPPLLTLLDRQAEASLAKAPASTSLAARVSQAIHDEIRAHAPPAVGGVARSLGTSARTLQRRLADEGTGFHEVLDAVREQLARAQVADPTRPLGEVAFLLGYSQLSTFLRAFRRWTGTTPGHFRKR